MGGSGLLPRAPEEVVGAICLWLNETFEPDFVYSDGLIWVNIKRSNEVTESVTLYCYDAHLQIHNFKLAYEDPEFFDYLQLIIEQVLEGGFDKLDCLLYTLQSLQLTQGASEDTRGSEGRITPDPEPAQPASLIYYLRYRYASTKQGKP